jgi:OmpA-OmpF porin, OOP family
MKFGKIKMTAAAIALAALPAVAAAQATTPPSQTLGFYVGASGGLTNANLDYSTYAPPAGGAWNSEDTAGAVKGFAGWRFHKYFGIEGGYYYLGKMTQDYSSPGGTGTVTNTLNAWVLDAVGYLPIAPNFSAIGRLGAVNGRINTDLLGVTPANLLPVSTNNTNFTWGLGAQLDINNQWALRAEYENLGKFGDSSTGDMRVNLWSAGALFKF